LETNESDDDEGDEDDEDESEMLKEGETFEDIDFLRECFVPYDDGDGKTSANNLTMITFLLLTGQSHATKDEEAGENDESLNEMWEDLEAKETSSDSVDVNLQKKIELKSTFDLNYDNKFDDHEEVEEIEAKEPEKKSETFFFDQMKREIEEKRAKTMELFG
jgi:hypothetical protein